MSPRALSLHRRARRFQAVLAARGGEATLRVVETTDFNQLPHVALAFRPGSDGAVRAFLAGRLADVKAACAALTRDLQAATARRAARAPAGRTFFGAVQTLLSSGQRWLSRRTL